MVRIITVIKKSNIKPGKNIWCIHNTVPKNYIRFIMLTRGMQK